MTSDTQRLLTDFVKNGSEEAFRQLVDRYTDLVYSTAVRMADGDVHLAQDVTQAVFLDLAKMAGKLSGEVMLGGWLHRHTCFVCSTLLRAERRRRNRERQAAEMKLHTDSGTGLDQIRPVLDEAINQLNEADRKAIVFRFFEQASFRAVGEGLAINEDAARMRVARALEKLYLIMRKRGFAGSSAALGTLLAGSAVATAPSGLAATVGSTALAGFSSGNSSVATLFKIITMTKLKTTLVGALLVAGVAVPLAIHRQAQTKLQAQTQALKEQADQLAQLVAENGRLSNLLASTTADGAPDQTRELLRLRGEVGALKRQLASSSSQQNTPRVQLTPSARADSQEQEKEIWMAKMNYTKQSILALINYAQQNQGRFPTNLATAEPALVDEARQRNLAIDQFELVYQGLMTDLANPGNTILMREKEPRQTSNGTWKKVYGFADGHSEIHESADGNFQDWEHQRMILPGPPAQPGQ